MAQVTRLQTELRGITGVAAPEVALAQPEAAEPSAPAVVPNEQLQPTVILNDATARVATGDGSSIPRPPTRPAEIDPTAAPASADPPATESEPTLAAEPDSAPESVPVSAPAGAEEELRDIGRQLIEANVAVRGVNAATSRQLLEEMGARLDLLRRRQADEESLVEHDRSELARVQDLISRGLVPATEADVAERALLMSSMQSYDTADAVARLEIEQARLNAELDRAPSEAARDLLLELEARTADAEVALAQLQSIDQRLALLGGPTTVDTTVTFDFVLHRGSGPDAVATPVDQDETLLPGDVLEIVASLPDGVLSQSSR
jgi:hypothetical protein